MIVTPSASGISNFVYKEESDKYEKAVGYREKAAKPRIIRDIDFFIFHDLFSKLKTDDKRRVVMEYYRDDSLFGEKAAKKVENFILSKAKDDPYLMTIKLNRGNLDAAAVRKKENAVLLIPDIKERAVLTRRDWQKNFSLSEGIRLGEKGFVLKKCKALNDSIRVPEKIEEEFVIAIDRNAFSNLGDYTKEVMLPDSVVYIENCAFTGCSALQRVIVFNPKCMIQPDAFVNCPNLKEIIVGGRNIAKGSSTFIAGADWVRVDIDQTK